jgi:hypothetical protein
MEEVARAAPISRPCLYFLFTSKEALFRAADISVELGGDVATRVANTLVSTSIGVKHQVDGMTPTSSDSRLLSISLRTEDGADCVTQLEQSTAMARAPQT